MTSAKAAIDPLWQCLCPAWTTISARSASRVLRARRPALRCLNTPPTARAKSDAVARKYAMSARYDGRMLKVMSPIGEPPPAQPREPKPRKTDLQEDEKERIDFANESTGSLYSRMRSAAIDGHTNLCRQVVEVLVRDRREKPNLQLYNALILSNVGYKQGAAWRVDQLLEEMQEEGLQPDIGTCHAALKVLSVHVDHLLRTDILDYMNKRWYSLSEDGAHDVAAGLFREGLFEQALERIDMMRRDDVRIQAWLLDMAVYVLCEASEISEAYRIMHQRFESGELNLSRSLWSFFLDKASEARHHAATSMVWSSQVNQNYINPSSGTCLNVLGTAAYAADAVMATEVFTHLSKRGTAFQPIHYELLISTYLSLEPPDLNRALTILTIMALEKLEPSAAETRALFLYLQDKPSLVPQALDTLRGLHTQGRKIPIAALNLLIECYVEQGNLTEALKLYKQIHTFNPVSDGPQKTFANIETFNLLLKGCRVVDPPDASQASFLVSELLALRIKPTLITYDRLILVLVHAGARSQESKVAEHRSKGLQLLDWAYRHFADMRELHWTPRLGTLEKLGIALAKAQDERCWDVLQAAEDNREDVYGWDQKGHWVRKNVEEAWEKGEMARESGAQDDAEGVEKDAAAAM